MGSATFEHRSVVPAPQAEVWHRVVTPEGINDEMRPWMTMAVPRGADTTTIENIELGVPAGRAWLRLFGVVPFDYDYLTLAELDEGHRFLERSTMLSIRRWQHDRTVTALSETTTEVHDRVTFEPRLPVPGLARLLTSVLSAFFRHRHRRLRAHFAGN